MIPPIASEADLKAACLALAAAHGWEVEHRQHGYGVRKASKTAKGYVDLTLARRGVVMFWELKDQTGQLEPDQVRWRDAIEPDLTIPIALRRWWLIRPSDIVSGFAEELLR